MEFLIPDSTSTTPCHATTSSPSSVLKAREDDAGRTLNLARPLRAGGFDDQDAVLELHRRGALERRADRRPPREPHLAVGERRPRAAGPSARREWRESGSTDIICDRRSSFDYLAFVRLSWRPRRRAAPNCCARPASRSTRSSPTWTNRVRPGETPSRHAMRRLATEKSARPSGRSRPGGRAATYVVLGADTAVVVDGEILGKPRDDDDAAAMLRQLSGRRHEVMTGVSLRQGRVRARPCRDHRRSF